MSSHCIVYCFESNKYISYRNIRPTIKKYFISIIVMLYILFPFTSHTSNGKLYLIAPQMMYTNHALPFTFGITPI